jgi:transposase
MTQTSALPQAQAVLGIDISKLYFDVTLIRIKAAVKGKASMAKHKRFANTPDGFKQLSVWLKTCRIKQVHACQEATGRYGDELALWLHTQKHIVSVVNPAIIHAYAKVQLRRNKTDALDADLIARFCLQERPQIWTPPTQETLDLQALLKRLADLKAIRQQESNRLTSIIPCPQAADFVQQHIDFLDAQIAALEATAKSLTKATASFAAQFKLLLTIPGIGSLTAMRLIAFDLLRFEDADAAVAMVGLNPSQHQSGTSCKRETHLSKRGHADMRKALFMPALTAITHNPFVRDLAARLSAQPKPKHPMVILGAAMRKLLRLAYGVLNSNLPFDPAYSSQLSPRPSLAY